MLRRLYGLIDTPARSTIWEWLVRCGFTYTKRKKRYFVDTHESAANRKYRKEQTARYLRRERRMHRWYQLPLNEVNTLISEGLLVPGKGYNYETINGEKMVEFHVDDIPEINVIDNKTENKLRTKIEEECLYGGNLSVRKEPEEKPLLAFGHDECIFWQFIFTGLAWVGVKGELPIIPKDEGFGIMVSAFQSREFGFGFALTLDNLKAVNEFRTLHRPNYTETESAIKILGNAKKKDLSESPFVKYFEYGYGQGKEGYWTYDHMAIQFEDCVDCIQCLFPQFDSVWQFDHSCGHDRGRDDGLNVSNMSVNWGGKQRKLRSTQMLQEEGFLGPHSPKLTVGDFQSMVFENEDDGPFYMPPNLQQIRKHDEVRGKKIKNRLKKDLCEELDWIGISTRGKTLKVVQEIATAKN